MRDVTLIDELTESKAWKLVDKASALVAPLGWLALAFSLLALWGYISGNELLYRPVEGGPATNPLTAICILLIGFTLLVADKQRQRRYMLCAVLAAVLLPLLRLLDLVLSKELAPLITPFWEQVSLQDSEGRDNRMGGNSAFMLLLIALALLAYHMGWKLLCQAVAFIALGVPTVSFAGYFYGLNEFYGHMSMVTSVTGFLLAIATLALTANQGALRAMLSPYVAGMVTRLQIVVACVIPTGMGYLLVNTWAAEGNQLLGAFVVVICWLNILMSSISAVYQESADNRRRESERRLADAAMHDALTGLYNRRFLFEFGEREIRRAGRSGASLGLIVMDVDKFKRINDSRGHELGDRVLLAISRCLQRSIRACDVASRSGGDEFVLLLSDSSEKGLQRVAEKIRAAIEAMHVPGWTDSHGPVTVSLGCAINNGSTSLEQSLIAADAALYQAKRNGSNQVTVAQQQLPGAPAVLA